jgi:hypothetical protein
MKLFEQQFPPVVLDSAIRSNRLETERKAPMRIDNNFAQKIPTAAIQRQREVPGEREPDGDADDTARAISRSQPPKNMLYEGTGQKVDILA